MIGRSAFGATFTRAVFQSLAWAALCLGTAGAGQSAGGQTLAVYQQECGACHVAYPAGMLPAASWERVLGHLNSHFGVDASLDATAERDIRAWLQQRAGTFRHAASEKPVQDRITHTRWWRRQHDEVSAAAFKRTSVGSASNCGACHPNASLGKFSERDVKIPR